MQEIHRRLIQRREAAAQIGAVYKFVFSGEGGGTFVVNLKDDVGVQEADRPAACTLRFDTADGLALLEGRANGMMMVATGKMKLDGDYALAMKLPALLGMLK